MELIFYIIRIKYLFSQVVNPAQCSFSIMIQQGVMFMKNVVTSTLGIKLLLGFTLLICDIRLFIDSYHFEQSVKIDKKSTKVRFKRPLILSVFPISIYFYIGKTNSK